MVLCVDEAGRSTYRRKEHVRKTGELMGFRAAPAFANLQHNNEREENSNDRCYASTFSHRGLFEKHSRPKPTP